MKKITSFICIIKRNEKYKNLCLKKAVVENGVLGIGKKDTK